MKQSCLVKAHYAGLGSLINNAMLWSFEYENVSVDWSGCLYGPKTWDSLFCSPASLLEPFDTVCVHPESADSPLAWLTWRWAGLLYQGANPQHLDWRERCHEKWIKHFNVRRETEFFADWFAKQRFIGKTVAAQIRYHGHAGEQLPPHRSQSLEEYAAAISAENPDTIYIASSDSESLAWMQVRFGTKTVWHPTARRSPTRETDLHRAVPQCEQDAIDALVEILLLSRANTLIHGVSNMATAALYINPSLKSVYLP